MIATSNDHFFADICLVTELLLQRLPEDLICPNCCHSLGAVPSQATGGSDSSERIEGNSDSLVCASCGLQAPIIGGIPRFVEQEHLASFGLQWNRYEVAHDDEDRATFEAKTGMQLADLKGLRVLDAGCGGGRYCKVATEAGAIVVGADHTSAVEKASKLCRQLPTVKLVQADLKHLPFKPGSFDFVFSIGVMHHDCDTKSVFDAVAPMVKPGGRLSVWLYRRNTFWQEWINSGLRYFTTRMQPERLEPLCRLAALLGGIPLIKQSLSKVINFSTHPVWENRVCDNFDWYAPQYQFHHTTQELCDWFEAAGFRDLRILPPEKTGAVYRWAWRSNLIIGSGVNVTGVRAD